MSKYILAIIMLICTALSAQARVEFGCLTTTQRVLREEPLPISKQVHFYAAKNERRSFQIFVRSNTPAKITSVVISNLSGVGNNTIDASNAKLFREHQLHITQPSLKNTNFKAGWYPDALIPFVNPIDGKPLKGARFTAVPFELPADETHGFWIDVFVPETTFAGDYKGKVILKIEDTENQSSITVSVTLSVWDFKLPDTPTLRTNFGSPKNGFKVYYTRLKELKKITAEPKSEILDKQVANLLTENRFSAIPPFVFAPVLQGDGSYAIPAEQINAFRQFADKYNVNLFRVAHPKSFIKDPELEKDKLFAWLKAWDKAVAELNRPQITFILYVIDEPGNEEGYKFARTWGRTIKEAKSVIKVMVTEQPKPQNPAWGDLYGSIDIWCPLFSKFDGPIEAQRQALGETIWAYTALCQGDPTPWWLTDHPLLNYNVPAWISWRYGIRGLLYWGGMNFWNDAEDVWTQPITLDRSDRAKNQVYNGEGSITYPAFDVGFDGLAESMRLKALRDAINDYEYMYILESRGQKAEAMNIVEPLAPSWFKWETDSAAYEKARIALANLIVKKK